MIRCTNKVYLAERLSAAGVLTPKTVVVQSLKDAEGLGDQLGWPVVLKTPDGAFSRGVFKCDDGAALKERLKSLLDESDLLIAQAFLPTNFDWRVGVLDGEPLFACQYHMVKRHWQIVRHEAGKTPDEGGFTTVALDETPLGVVETAVKAARLMGNGLYGVDLKQTPDRVFVIEVNDNPDLNHGIEDAREKDAVWEKLVKWYWDRLEA
jgi:glutathione synthase/RimK-type ligase-like ATP-grasp enzyme